jgi:hypothetical protein
MSFQIIDSENNQISLDKADEIAAKFWNVEIKPKYYAEPAKAYGLNWVDTIKAVLTDYNLKYLSWKGITTGLLQKQVCESLFIGHSLEFEPFTEEGEAVSLSDKVQLEIMARIEYYRPYVELINHFASLGWKINLDK